MWKLCEYDYYNAYTKKLRNIIVVLLLFKQKKMLASLNTTSHIIQL